MWSLTQRWYGDRLVPGHRPKSVDELQRLLDDVGLTEDFWQLR
jgi:hypothetical protein